MKMYSFSNLDVLKNKDAIYRTKEQKQLGDVWGERGATMNLVCDMVNLDAYEISRWPCFKGS